MTAFLGVYFHPSNAVVGYHSGHRTASVPWTKVNRDKGTMLEYGCEMDINWDDPSRLDQSIIRKNWKAMIGGQKNFLKTGKIPVIFTPASFPTASKDDEIDELLDIADKASRTKKRKIPYVEVTDEEAEGELSAEDDGEGSPRRSGRLSAKKPSGSSRIKSKPTVETDDDEDKEPPRKKARAATGASEELSHAPPKGRTQQCRATTSHSVGRSSRDGATESSHNDVDPEAADEDAALQPIPPKKKGKGKAKAGRGSEPNSDVDLELFEDISRRHDHHSDEAESFELDTISSGNDESDEDSVVGQGAEKHKPLAKLKAGPYFGPGAKISMSRKPSKSGTASARSAATPRVKAEDFSTGDDNLRPLLSARTTHLSADGTLTIPDKLPTSSSGMDINSPAFALLEGHQKEFLESLSTRLEYANLVPRADLVSLCSLECLGCVLTLLLKTHMQEGAFAPYLPPYLSWSWQEALLPLTFHRISCSDLQSMMDKMFRAVRARGGLTHCELLAAGLIMQEVYGVLDVEPGSIVTPERYKTS